MYHVDRATAMTAYFLEKGQGRMNDIKLAKLQYLAERKAIVDLMSPIAYDYGISLFHGPCLSKTLNLTNDRAADPVWDAHIGFEWYTDAPEFENTVVLKESVRWDESLSEADLEILDQVWSTFGAMDKVEIKRWCHNNLHEYKHVEKGQWSPITLEDIFIAEGDSPEEAALKAEEIRYHEDFTANYGAKREMVI